MSWQSHVLNVVLQMFVKSTKQVPSMTSLRVRLEKLSLRIPPPRGNMLVEEMEVDGIRTMRVSMKDAPAKRTIYYLHGGGYCFCSPHTHRGILMYLCKATGATVIAPFYRLAPEHPYPAGLEDALTVWRWLIQRVDPTRIVIGGDSAGGGLTLATLGRLVEDKQPLPAASFLLSPWTDLTLSGETIYTNRKSDVMFRKIHLQAVAAHYLGDVPAPNSLVSPLFLDKHGFPPVMIQASDSEMLFSDSSRLVASYERAGVPVIFDAWHNMPHVWQVFLGRIPEASRALRGISQFICEQIPEHSAVES